MIPTINQISIDVVRDWWMLTDGSEVLGTAHEPMMNNHFPRSPFIALDTEQWDTLTDVLDEMQHVTICVEKIKQI